jgi:hypothetical protein
MTTVPIKSRILDPSVPVLTASFGMGDVGMQVAVS